MKDGRKFWIIGAIILVAIGVFLTLQLVGTTVLAVFFYYSVRPAYRRLDEHIPTHNIPAALALLLFVVPAFMLMVYTVVVSLHELTQFAQTLDGNAVSAWLTPILNQLNLPPIKEVEPAEIFANPWEFISSDSIQFTEGLLKLGVAYLGSITTVLLHLFLVFTLTFYLVRDDEKIANSVRTTFEFSKTTSSFFSKLDRRLYYVFFGNVLNALLTAVIGAISFSILEAFFPIGTGYPVLIGVLCGLGSLVPIVGMKIVYMPVSGLFYFWSFTRDSHELFMFTTAFTITAAVVVDIIPDLFVRPFISGRTTHVGALMVAYVVGPMLFGWYGLFLGPLLLVVGMTFYEIILPELTTSNQHRLDDFL